MRYTQTDTTVARRNCLHTQNPKPQSDVVVVVVVVKGQIAPPQLELSKL
jgi:hypothetical protein